jgi:hypothetical protein
MVIDTYHTAHYKPPMCLVHGPVEGPGVISRTDSGTPPASPCAGSGVRIDGPPARRKGPRPDTWTSVRLKGSRVIADSWLGYMVEFDLDTGGEIVRTFTK